MTWFTGSSLGFKVLLDEIRANAVTAGWTVDSYVTGAGVEDPDVLFIHGPGAGTDRRAYVYMETFADISDDRFAIKIQGGIGYSNGSPIDEQPGASPDYTVCLLWESSAIPYWMSITDRRILVIAKVSTTYRSIYAGFFLPYATPVEYPFPLYIASDSYSIAHAWQDTATYIRGFWDPGSPGSVADDSRDDVAARIRLPDGVWLPINNHRSSGTSERAYDTSQYGKSVATLSPYNTPDGYNISESAFEDSFGNVDLRTIQGIVPSTAATRLMLPVQIVRTTFHYGVIGALDGVYYVPTFGISAEVTLTIDSTIYQVFQNIHRVSKHQYVAIQQK